MQAGPSNASEPIPLVDTLELEHQQLMERLEAEDLILIDGSSVGKAWIDDAESFLGDLGRYIQKTREVRERANWNGWRVLPLNGKLPCPENSIARAMSAAK